VNAISNGFIVHRDTLIEKQSVRDFLQASLQGFLYATKSPDKMAQIIGKYRESSDPVITKRGAELSWSLWVTPTTTNKSLGSMAAEDWSATAEALRKYGGVTNDLNPSQLYTNEFVPAAPEFIPLQNV